MKTAQVSAMAAGVNVKDPKTVAGFVRQVREDALEGPRAVVDLLGKRPVNVGLEVPLLLIPELEELSVIPLVELGTGKPTAKEYGWAVGAMADGFLAMRRKVVARLMGLLEDVTPVPQSVMENSEAQPYERRICDEAYLALRRVMKAEEDPKEAGMEMDAFLSQSNGMKDKTIKDFKKSKVFANFVAF